MVFFITLIKKYEKKVRKNRSLRERDNNVYVKLLLMRHININPVLNRYHYSKLDRVNLINILD